MEGEDLSLYFCEFVSQAQSGGREIPVILDREYLPMFGQGYLGQELGAEGVRITALARTDHLTGLHHGDTFTVDGTAYKIRGFEPQGDGRLTEVILGE